MAALLVVAAAAAGGFATARFFAWREAKLALLQPAPGELRPSPPPDPAAVGGLLLFGDSRIAGWRPLPRRPYPIARLGYAGESAIRLAPEFERALDRFRPRLAIIQVGVNDAVAASLLPAAARGEAQAKTEAAFARMAEAARARGVPLVILSILPPVRPDLPRRLVWRGAVGPYVAAVNAALAGLAARHGASVVDPLPLLGGDPEAVPDRFFSDPLHLSAEGYRALGPLLPDRLPGLPSPE